MRPRYDRLVRVLAIIAFVASGLLDQAHANGRHGGGYSHASHGSQGGYGHASRNTGSGYRSRGGGYGGSTASSHIYNPPRQPTHPKPGPTRPRPLPHPTPYPPRPRPPFPTPKPPNRNPPYPQPQPQPKPQPQPAPPYPRPTPPASPRPLPPYQQPGNPVQNRPYPQAPVAPSQGRLPPEMPYAPTRPVVAQPQAPRPTSEPPRNPPAPYLRPGFIIPALSERRFVPNEVLLTIRADVPPADLQRFEQQFDLTPLTSSRIGLLNADLRRYAVRDGTDVRQAIQSLKTSPAFVATAQPNYLFDLQDDGKNPDAGAPPIVDTAHAEDDGNLVPVPGMPTQYAVDALQIDPAHRLATGDHVTIAVIDTGLDENHPDLAGMVSDRFDAVGGTFTAHAHGTAMAGVIVANKTLVGIAPNARIIAVRAFDSPSGGGANGNGYDIVRGLDFAVAHGAQIINMSFAGPRDTLLSNALREARNRGVIEVAAAGNGGPTSQPLYPAAEPGILAVTATDANNKLFAMANRGNYVAFAAPGVNILAPSTDGAMQLTSGTSVATAEASGIIALLLENHSRIGSDQVRTILSSTALHLPADSGAGAGVLNAFAALNALTNAGVAANR